VPTAIASRTARPALAILAGWLLVLQAFLAGLATAQAAVAPGGDAVLCHDAGDGAGGEPGSSDRAAMLRLCCAGCVGSVPTAAAPADPPQLLPFEPRPAAGAPAPDAFAIVLSPGAVRAGFSQGPPVRA
jgi:hypothetical protein